MALFDFRVVDTDALSYLSHSPAAVMASAEAEKKWKYCAAFLIIVLPSHLYVFWVDGFAGDETNSLLRHLVYSLSFKWDRSFSDILGWLHACLAKCIGLGN